MVSSLFSFFFLHLSKESGASSAGPRTNCLSSENAWTGLQIFLVNSLAPLTWSFIMGTEGCAQTVNMFVPWEGFPAPLGSQA